MVEHDDAIDFAVAAYREDGAWTVDDLTPEHLVDVESIAEALRHLPGDSGAVAMVAVDEDFFVIVRVDGARTRVLLSDVTAADDWDLAASAADFVGAEDPEDPDEEEPAGDLGLLADLGLSADDLEDLLDEDDLYPDELLSDVASTLGFGEEFDDVVGLTTA